MALSQKRDPLKVAFNHGYQSGFRGRSQVHCPYVTRLDLREVWMSGWREGREIHSSDYKHFQRH